METKKLISAVAALALAANMGLASVAFAASTGTGSAELTSGGYSVDVGGGGTVTFATDTQSNDACDDGPLVLGFTAFNSCGTGNILVSDLAGVSTNRTITMSINQPLKFGTYALPLNTTQGFGINMETAGGFTYNAGGAAATDFSAVTPTDYTGAAILASTNYPVVLWNKSSVVLNFSASVDLVLQQDIPNVSSSLAVGTYTNTLTFTAS